MIYTHTRGNHAHKYPPLVLTRIGGQWRAPSADLPVILPHPFSESTTKYSFISYIPSVCDLSIIYTHISQERGQWLSFSDHPWVTWLLRGTSIWIFYFQISVGENISVWNCVSGRNCVAIGKETGHIQGGVANLVMFNDPSTHWGSCVVPCGKIYIFRWFVVTECCDVIVPEL